MQAIDRKHLCFKHPFTCMLAGPTGSGKTVLIRRILKDYDKTLYFNSEIPLPLKVMWAYGQWQDLYNEKLGECDVQYIEGLPTKYEIDNFQPHVMVIDDLMNESGNDKQLGNLFTKGSHHMNISIIFISQNLFHQGSQMRAVGLNSQYKLLTKNPNEKSQIATLAARMYPYNSKFFIKAFEDATSVPYGYIRVDSRQDTPELYRIQTRITPEELPGNTSFSLSPIAYIPRDV